MQHRQDIQGLRAIAVLAVLAYHFDIAPFSGGFVGVDIFFVVSGYLITGMILSEADSGTFSFGRFFSRRLRRLGPALIATIVATFAVSAFLIYPEDFQRHSQATIFALLGASNILFWLEAGYFDAEATLKPLLHTWSLAVEIQFYLLWPFFLIGLHRIGPKSAPLWGIAAVLVCGVAASIWALSRDPVAAFYLTPFRMHEFAFGGLVWCLRERHPPSALPRELVYLFALAAVAATAVGYDATTPFPGVNVLPVAVATAVLIWLGPWTKSAAWIGSRPAAYVGELSYSAYLVHWPVLVLAIYAGDNLATDSRLVTGMLVALTVVLTVALHYLVEAPLRGVRPDAVRPAYLNAGCASAILLAIMPAQNSWATGGWPWRVTDVLEDLNELDVKTLKNYIWPRTAKLNAKAGFDSDKQRLLIVGDSQAADIVNLLLEGNVERKAEFVARVVVTECGLPYLDPQDRRVFLTKINPPSMKDPQWVEKCSESMERVVSDLAWGEADAVLVAFVWRDFTMPWIEASIRALTQRTKAPVYVAGGKLMMGSSIRLANEHKQVDGLAEYARGRVSPATLEANELLRRLPYSRYVDILSTFCDERSCHMVENGKPVLSDVTHFTLWGARFAWGFGGKRVFAFITESSR